MGYTLSPRVAGQAQGGKALVSRAERIQSVDEQ